VKEKHLRKRIRGLPPDIVAALRQAAVLGPEFAVLELQALTSLSARELVGVVEAGVAAGMLTGAGPRLAFRPAGSHGWVARMNCGQATSRSPHLRRLLVAVPAGDSSVSYRMGDAG
jgi:hypothetical protein